nr:5325_t:CDS:2 [Entrophospora candida]
MAVTVETGRAIVILANTLSSISALILIGASIYGMIATDVHFASYAIPLASFILGLFVLLVSMVGCCGAVIEHKQVLIAYFIILTVLIIAQVNIAIIMFSNARNVENILDKAWDKAYVDQPGLIRDIEHKYFCCGFRNTKDRAIPKSSPDACEKNPWFGYDQSCLASLTNVYKSNQTALGILGLILAIVQVLALLASFILLKSLPNHPPTDQDYRNEYEGLVRSAHVRDPERQPSKSTNTGRSKFYGST